MLGINKVILIGNAGRDPDYKLLQDGTSVAKITIATSESYRLKNGDLHTHTEWHSIILWRGLANFAHQYIHKGNLIYIEGKLRSRRYDDKEGIKKYITEIVADRIILLDKKIILPEKEEENSAVDRLPF